jgi:cell division protein FtsN
MLKYIFLLINSISILFFNLFFGDGVSITPKLPSSAKPNSEFVAEFVVKKGGTSGFAKLQIDLPQGLSAKEIESKGGSFTYSNGVVKYIWTSLPSDEEFTIKFNVIADGTVSGTKQIQGKFSYITNNAKQQADFGPLDIMFDANSSAAVAATNTVAPTTNTVAPTNTNTVVATTNTTTVNENKMPETFSPPKDPNAAVSVHRRITALANNEFLVDLVIHKETLKGFAKYTDKIPAGFRATAVSTNGASFSFNDQIAKLVWVSLPASEELKVSYKLNMETKPESKVSITGEFSYLENDQTQKVKSQEDEIIIPAETVTPVATNTIVPETNTVTPTETVTPVETNTVVNTNTVTPTNTVAPTNTVVTTNTVAVVETPTTTPTSTVTGTIKDPENNTTATNTNKTNASVNFQVQVGAFKNNISTDKIASMYNINDNIRTDMHEGLTKFLVGSYNDYKGARDKRENIKNKGVTGAFVTAYNSGKRITIQEALMITSQKWLR